MEVNDLYINLMSQLDIHMRLAFLLSFTYCWKNLIHLYINLKSWGKERFFPNFEPHFLQIIFSFLFLFFFFEMPLFLWNKIHCALVITWQKIINYGVVSENIFSLNVKKPTILLPSILLISLKLIIIKDDRIFRFAMGVFGTIFNLFIWSTSALFNVDIYVYILRWLRQKLRQRQTNLLFLVFNKSVASS